MAVIAVRGDFTGTGCFHLSNENDFAVFSDISRHVQFSSIYVYSIALTEHTYCSKAAFKK